MDDYEKLNEVLVQLFNDTLEVERKYVEKSRFRDISVNDMHILEAIGIDGAKSMSAIAKLVGVTVGTLTIAVNSLVKKGYVARARSQADRRVVLISLTEKGRSAYSHHEDFHRKMVEGVLKELSDEQIQVLVKAMTNLKEFFYSYK